MTCAGCGQPARGLAYINEDRYCHEGPSPTCYEIASTWRAWRRGDSRCPYCRYVTCPIEWHSMCDCFMAPEPPADHPWGSCDTCNVGDGDFL